MIDILKEFNSVVVHYISLLFKNSPFDVRYRIRYKMYNKKYYFDINYYLKQIEFIVERKLFAIR
jgi:hypothetical protein